MLAVSGRGAPFRGGAGGRQVGVGEHRQGDVPIPGGVVPHLVGGQAGFVLGHLEAFLDAPAGPGHGEELLEVAPDRAEGTDWGSTAGSAFSSSMRAYGALLQMRPAECQELLVLQRQL